MQNLNCGDNCISDTCLKNSLIWIGSTVSVLGVMKLFTGIGEQYSAERLGYFSGAALIGGAALQLYNWVDSYHRRLIHTSSSEHGEISI